MGRSRQHRQISELLGGDLVDASWLRRLARISFLGTLDGHPRARRRASRLDHSLAVAALGEGIARSLQLPSAAARTFVAACLLHDVGHYPLSHAAEPAFHQVLGADHHQLSRWIICGDGEIEPARSLRPLLTARKIDADEVWAILAGEASLSGLLRAPVNLDTLDGITRVARNFGLSGVRLPDPLFVWIGGEPGIASAAIPAFDAFWRLKDRVYSRVINLPSNILAEARLCEHVATAVTPSLLRELERFDDAMLARVLNGSSSGVALRPAEDDAYDLCPSAAPVQGLVRVRKRYFIDTGTTGGAKGLAMTRWAGRYRHLRERAALVARDHQLELSWGTPQQIVEDPEI